jgi:hypothetical protein
MVPETLMERLLWIGSVEETESEHRLFQQSRLKSSHSASSAYDPEWPFVMEVDCPSLNIAAFGSSFAHDFPIENFPMPIDLDELLERVNDEQSFIGFIEALGSDFASERVLEQATPSPPNWTGALEWENQSVDGFLEAAAAWATASARSSPAPTTNVWQRCASILLAGKFYE